MRSFMHTIFIDYSNQKLFFAICVVKNMPEILFQSNKKQKLIKIFQPCYPVLFILLNQIQFKLQSIFFRFCRQQLYNTKDEDDHFLFIICSVDIFLNKMSFQSTLVLIFWGFFLNTFNTTFQYIQYIEFSCAVCELILVYTSGNQHNYFPRRILT